MWRLLIHGAEDGARNMAIDRAVLAGRVEGTSPPTVRLYRWARPTVSLGRFQKIGQVDLDACTALGFDVVRRPTGGRGVLHDDEVTYCVVVSVADGVPRGTAASYAWLCEPLADAYRTLGVEASVTRRDAPAHRSGACYLQTTRADLSLGAAKLSGSAQVWERESVLQHGSFVLSRDSDAEARVFRLSALERQELEAHTATIQGATGMRPSEEEVAEAIVGAFERVRGVSLEPGTLSELERRRAEEWRPDHEIGSRA